MPKKASTRLGPTSVGTTRSKSAEPSARLWDAEFDAVRGYVNAACPTEQNFGYRQGYDFTFSFSPIGALQAVRSTTAEGAEASDPSGGISLFDALNKQLGLKLETVKRPVQVLVIDKIERKPVEN